VLGWHNVEPTWFFPAAPGAGRRGFTRQLAFLRRFANVVPLGTALQALAEGGRCHRGRSRSASTTATAIA
jgi:hypothetical protein